MKKKVISLMLIGAMVASMAACGSNGGDKGGATMTHLQQLSLMAEQVRVATP